MENITWIRYYISIKRWGAFTHSCRNFTIGLVKSLLKLRHGWVIRSYMHLWMYLFMPDTTQITKFMGPAWGPLGSCRPQMGPMLAPWTLLSGNLTVPLLAKGPVDWYMIYSIPNWGSLFFLLSFLSGMVFPAVCLVAVSFLGCHQAGVVSLLVVGTGMSAITHAGFMTNYLDIAPVFAGRYRIFWT